MMNWTEKVRTRREMLQWGAGAAAGMILPQFFLSSSSAWGADLRDIVEQTAQQTDNLTAFRAQMAAAPIITTKLGEKLMLLSGPGGNVVVLDGPDGKLLVDNFVAPAWPKLKETLEGMGSSPVKTAIDTHWHFDHADNNGPLHALGATIVAHENTKKRMSAHQHVPVLELDCPPTPAEALPVTTFADRWKTDTNGEHILLIHAEPAHTDTDVFVGFLKANVVHCGDLYFSAFYPFIDAGSGGKLAGMAAAADRILEVCDNDTKIVPGHGPLSNKAQLTKYREMLGTVLERVSKLKAAGKSVEEAIAAKPFADLDADWGKGLITSDLFVRVAYLTT